MPRPNPPTPVGTIETPGKFEGEPTYAPAAWDVVLSGFGEDIANASEHTITRVRAADIAGAWEALIGVAFVELWESDDGFVLTDAFCIHQASNWGTKCNESPNHSNVFKQGPEFVAA